MKSDDRKKELERWLAMEGRNRYHAQYKRGESTRGVYPPAIAERENKKRWHLLGVEKEKQAKRMKEKFERELLGINDAIKKEALKKNAKTKVK